MLEMDSRIRYVITCNVSYIWGNCAIALVRTIEEDGFDCVTEG